MVMERWGMAVQVWRSDRGVKYPQELRIKCFGWLYLGDEFFGILGECGYEELKIKKNMVAGNLTKRDSVDELFAKVRMALASLFTRACCSVLNPSVAPFSQRQDFTCLQRH